MTRRALGANAKQRGRLQPAALPATGWPTGKARRHVATVRGGGVCCARGQRAIDHSALGQRQVAVIMPDRERKDRRLGQFFIVEATVSGVACCGGNNRSDGEDAMIRSTASPKLVKRPQAKSVGHGVIGPDLLERRFPAQPLAEIGPDRKARPQRPPMHRPVAAAGVLAQPRRNVADRVEALGKAAGTSSAPLKAGPVKNFEPVTITR